LAEDFLFCGSSALLLLVANLFPAYWYFSFIALLPFLWRIREGSPQRGLRLGLLLGLTFWVFSSLDVITAAFWATLVKIFCGTILFALWGWIVGLARRRLGFNPVIVAGLWVFFELGLVKLGYTSGLIAHSVPTGSFALRMVTLFGFGMLSFLIILLDSIIVKTVELAVKILKDKKLYFPTDTFCQQVFEEYGLVFQEASLVPEGRGPPKYFYSN